VDSSALGVLILGDSKSDRDCSVVVAEESSIYEDNIWQA